MMYLKAISTADLVKELKEREGVKIYPAQSPDIPYTIEVDGEVVAQGDTAVILEIKD